MLRLGKREGARGVQSQLGWGGSKWIPALQLLSEEANLSTETARYIV